MERLATKGWDTATNPHSTTKCSVAAAGRNRGSRQAPTDGIEVRRRKTAAANSAPNRIANLRAKGASSRIILVKYPRLTSRFLSHRRQRRRTATSRVLVRSPSCANAANAGVGHKLALEPVLSQPASQACDDWRFCLDDYCGRDGSHERQTTIWLRASLPDKTDQSRRPALSSKSLSVSRGNRSS